MADQMRVKLPDSYRTGDIIEVRTLTSHVMETGNRKTPEGEPIPRNIIHTLTATLAGKQVFRAELGPGIAANPYLAFHVRAAPGTLEIAWRDDRGQEGIERVTLAPG